MDYLLSFLATVIFYLPLNLIFIRKLNWDRKFWKLFELITAKVPAFIVSYFLFLLLIIFHVSMNSLLEDNFHGKTFIIFEGINRGVLIFFAAHFSFLVGPILKKEGSKA